MIGDDDDKSGVVDSRWDDARHVRRSDLRFVVRKMYTVL